MRRNMAFLTADGALCKVGVASCHLLFDVPEIFQRQHKLHGLVGQQGEDGEADVADCSSCSTPWRPSSTNART